MLRGGLSMGLGLVVRSRRCMLRFRTRRRAMLRLVVRRPASIAVRGATAERRDIRDASGVQAATAGRRDIRDVPGAQAALRDAPQEQAASEADNRELGESPAGQQEPDVIRVGPSAQAADLRELLRAPRDAREAEAARWQRSADARCWPCSRQRGRCVRPRCAAAGTRSGQRARHASLPALPQSDRGEYRPARRRRQHDC